MKLNECSLAGEREGGMWTSCMAEIPCAPGDWCANCVTTRAVLKDRERVLDAVMAFAQNKMHAGWHADLRKLIAEVPL